jgi:CelD/BcsL family acetyltransferase involved in cellulose biosynthesis
MTRNELLTIKVVTDTSGLEGLQDEWSRLLRDSRTASICLTWEWLYTWWEMFGESAAELHVLLLRAEGRLVGIAPLIVMTHRERGLIKVRTLRFLGTGEPEWEEAASEYIDIIASDGYEKPVAEHVWAYLQSRTCQWDQIVFNDVMEDSVVMTHLKGLLLQAGIRPHLAQIGTRYRIDLPSSWDAYLAMLDPGARKRFQYKRRKLEKAGRVAEMHVTIPDELESAFNELVRLHAMRWTSRGRPGVFISDRFVSYHKRLMRRLLDRGMLNLRLLSLDDVVISAIYNLRYGGTDYFYQAGFDTGNAAKYSPGIVAHSYAIEDSIRQGLKRYDFMKGGLTSYKSEFGCQESSIYDMRILGRTARGRILWLETRARSALRPLKRKWQSLAGFAARSS